MIVRSGTSTRTRFASQRRSRQAACRSWLRAKLAHCRQTAAPAPAPAPAPAAGLTFAPTPATHTPRSGRLRWATSAARPWGWTAATTPPGAAPPRLLPSFGTRAAAAAAATGRRWLSRLLRRWKSSAAESTPGNGKSQTQAGTVGFAHCSSLKASDSQRCVFFCFCFFVFVLPFERSTGEEDPLVAVQRELVAWWRALKLSAAAEIGRRLSECMA
jgi:hypothetical protein